MNTGRRSFMTGFAVALAGAPALRAAAQGQRHENSQIPPIPEPAGPDNTPLPPLADPKVQAKEDQKQVRRDVDRLLQMVKDLKDESDKTPEADVLSLSLVKKVDDIEKLAHQIKERIRAN